jgi:GR25 family glycosyltransferase involved in LPS biosynthesis
MLRPGACAPRLRDGRTGGAASKGTPVTLNRLVDVLLDTPGKAGPQALAGRRAVEVVIISLVNAAARRRAMTAMLEGIGFDWSFFDAHTGLMCPELRYDLGETKSRFGRAMTRQEIAVYSSHYAVLREFLERGRAEYVLVLEDDLVLDVDFPVEAFGAFCAERKLDYVRLFGKHYANAVRLGFFYDRSILRYTTSPAGAQAYLMSQRGAKIFTERFRTVNETVDLAMDRFWETGMPIYSIFPYPVIERYSPTSIPIPPHEGALRGGEKVAWNVRRVVSKARKIYANHRLAGADAQMRKRMPGFSQIFAG